MPRTILLIDGDQYLHKACAAVERDVRWDDENHVVSSNEVEAWEVIEGSIKKLLTHFGEVDHVVCFSDTDGTLDFRKEIDPTYKSHRVGTRKPLCFYDLKAKMQAELNCRSMPGLEADDVMGILSTKPSSDKWREPATKIIVSRDKDMKTIPGKLWDGTRFWNITEAEADYFHLFQTLCGDASDGYKGCPGIGPKKAEALLKALPDGPVDPELTHVERMWGAVVQAYEKAGLTEADALRNARLARILRWSDWDAEKKEPILWSPTGTI